MNMRVMAVYRYFPFTTWIVALVLTVLMLSSQDLRADTLEKQERESGEELVTAYHLSTLLVHTGTRSKKQLADVPVQTHVITAEQIDRQHARNAEEALRYVPGVRLVPIHGKTGYQAVIQGMDGDRVLVLVDGERVSASTGSTVDLTQIGVGAIDQIEVIRGASSALYGSSAMGGVINIVTQKPEPGFHGSVRLDAGGYGDKNLPDNRLPVKNSRGQLSWSVNRWEWLGSVEQRSSEGYRIEEDGYRLNGSAMDKGNALLRGSYKGDQSYHQLTYRRYREDQVKPDAVLIPGQPSLDRQESASSDRLGLVSEWTVSSQQKLEGRAYQESYEGETRADIERRIDIETGGIELNHEWLLNDQMTLSSGYAWIRETLGQLRNGVAELSKAVTDRESHAVYTQLDWMLGDHWELLPGVRLQEDSNFGGHVAPKLSLMRYESYENGEGRWRINLGSGYRVPNLKERYFVFDHSNLGYQVLGDPDLKPEESVSLQVGYEFTHNSRWMVRGNLFYNRFSNLLQTRFEGNDTSDDQAVAIYRYQNVSSAETRGVELDGQWHISPSLTLDASVTWLESQDRDTGLALVNNPEESVKIGMNWQTWRSGEWLVHGRYQSEEFLDEDNLTSSPSWVQWDIKYNHTFSDRWQAFAGVDNVNDVHRDPERSGRDQRPVPGRYAYAGMQWSF